MSSKLFGSHTLRRVANKRLKKQKDVCGSDEESQNWEHVEIKNALVAIIFSVAMKGEFCF